MVEYARIGVLGVAVKWFFKCLVKRQSFKGIYPEVLRRVEPMLVERYAPMIKRMHFAQKSEDNQNLNLTKTRISEFENRRIWFCWLQGLENAPKIVHACYNSLKRNIPHREIMVIDNKNWGEYVDLPEFIVRKWEKGRIPAALFSDLLRLELLIKYGGTWIDSTVLCTGPWFKVQEYLEADLFLFQYTTQGSIPVSISNWFITACKNNVILMALRDMLYAYWKDYDCTLDYYIFHLFFAMLSKEYPEKIAAMPYGSSLNSLVLLHHWSEKFDQKNWNKLTSQVSFHKLNYRVSEGIINKKDNYYHTIIERYS